MVLHPEKWFRSQTQDNYMFTILFSEKESRIGEYQVIATLVTVKLECKDPYQ